MKTLKVLIGDESREFEQTLAEELSKTGRQTDIQTTTERLGCLRALQQELRPDIIFLNLDIPGQQGYECLRELYRQDLVEDVPVIMFSKSQKMKIIQAVSLLGARFYLIVPASKQVLQQLLTYIFTLLSLPRPQQQQKQHFVVAQQKLESILNLHLSV